MNKSIKTTSKKEYLTPVISVEELIKQDVLTASDGENRVFSFNSLGSRDLMQSILDGSLM